MAEAPEFVYRAMTEDHGRPRIGAAATRLGVRVGKDIESNDEGEVERPDFDDGAPNGISCAPSIGDLPQFALPEEWGGANKRTRVWRLSTSSLSGDLEAERDGPGHVSIGPSRTMSLDEYTAAIENTSEFWELIVPGDQEAES